MPKLKQLPNIIGICGPARAGKDTIAAALTSEFGYQKDSFAAPIRAFVATMIGVTLAELETVKDFPSDALNGKTPRYAMQTLGTEWGRELIDKDVWVNYLIRRSCGQRLVVPDIRFTNEAEAIAKAGGLVLRVVRPGIEIVESGHASEAGIPDSLVDYTFTNEGTAQELQFKVVDHILYYYSE